MPKKQLISFLIFILLAVLLFPRPSNAQTKTPKRNELIPVRLATDASKLLLPPGITRMVEVISSRLELTAASVEKIQLRINTRIERMKENGLETTQLEILAENIQTQLKKLTTDLASETKLREALNQATNRKNALVTWRKQVIVVRSDLQNIIKQQKNLIQEMKKLATKSVSVTPKLEGNETD